MTQVYYSQGDPWDAHSDIFAHKTNAKNSDQAFAAVIKDLKTRGLWKDTLVVCGSEFGTNAGARSGRRGSGHQARARPQSVRISPCGWPEARSRAARSTAATDEFGFKAIEKPVHVHDIHATILYLFGIDHTKVDVPV